jgi:hypothetical protein
MGNVPTLMVAALTALALAAGLDHRAAIAMTMNCSDAETMMLKARSTVQQGKATMTGDVDKDFASMEVAVGKAQLVMAHVEMKCGKTTADKESAARLLRESQERLQMFRDEGQS